MKKRAGVQLSYHLNQLRNLYRIIMLLQKIIVEIQIR